MHSQSCPALCDPISHQAPLSMGFSRQECWSGLPFASPGDLPDSWIEPLSPALVGRFLHWATRGVILHSWKQKRACWLCSFTGCLFVCFKCLLRFWRKMYGFAILCDLTYELHFLFLWCLFRSQRVNLKWPDLPLPTPCPRRGALPWRYN